jgi:excisionase family DNA binding protein
MADIDFSTWLTKQQAAAAIGVSTKMVEQLAKDRRLEQAAWRRPTGGPALAVYNPDDVARIASERHPAPAPFVLPAVRDVAGNGTRTRAGNHAPGQEMLLAPATSADELVREFLHGLLRAATTPPTSENSEKLFLTLPEAAAVSGLSQAYLRRLIKDEALPAIRDRGWRIRRKDLEAL